MPTEGCEIFYMDDIRVAAVLMVFVSMAAFLLTFRLLKPRSKGFIDCIAVLIVSLLIAYGYLVFGQLWIVEWIPLPSVIVLSNWIPPILAALSAAVWLRLDSATWRRWPVMMLLMGAAAYAVFYFIPINAPECRNEWATPRPPIDWPVCLQTTPYTCSAASAATILNTLNIPTSEQEMAELCLTRSGTTWLGLYHGLSTKLLGSEYRVEFFETDVEGLQRMLIEGPVLLCCKLEPMVAKLVPEYVNEGGWILGGAHSVVYFGKRHDYHIIGDPSRGFEYWSTLDLNNLWTGIGLRVVRSKG